MSPLRKRFMQELQLRGLSPHTITNYVSAVAAASRFCKLSPMDFEPLHVRDYHLDQVKRGVCAYPLLGLFEQPQPKGEAATLLCSAANQNARGYRPSGDSAFSGQAQKNSPVSDLPKSRHDRALGYAATAFVERGRKGTSGPGEKGPIGKTYPHTNPCHVPDMAENNPEQAKHVNNRSRLA